MISEGLRRLGDVSREYATKAQEYGGIATAAAEAEAAYKHQRARFIVTRRTEDPKASVAYLEALAEADDTLAGLLRERLVTAAVQDAARQRLAQLREAVATGRTFASSEREADRIHSQGGTP